MPASLLLTSDLVHNRSAAYRNLRQVPITLPFWRSASSVGAILVFQEDDPDHFRKLEDFPVQKKVHSLAVDEQTHRVYAPEQEVDCRPAARMTIYEAVTGQAAMLR